VPDAHRRRLVELRVLLERNVDVVGRRLRHHRDESMVAPRMSRLAATRIIAMGADAPRTSCGRVASAEIVDREP
jgi:hypothetical protein